MLARLHIENYVLIENQDVEFPDGLVIISGPTGAGKSILIGALGLLCGAKADASSISPGADNCIVEGEFRNVPGELEALFEENDLEYDNGNVIIRRMVSTSGRSRAFVNDSPVGLPLLSRIAAPLVDIHSQHDSLILTNRTAQLGIIDAFAGNGSLLEDCRKTYAEYSSLSSAIEDLRRDIAQAASESSYNAEILQKLEQADLKEGELEQLEEEQKTLANSEKIKELLSHSDTLMDSDSPECPGICTSLGTVSRNFAKLSSISSVFAALSSRIESVRIDVEDISSEIRRLDASLDCSPERLEWLDNRLGLLYSLMRRHNVDSVAELLSLRDSLRLRSGNPELMQEELDSLLARRKEVSDKLGQICSSLHSSRVDAAEKMSARICSSLSYLEMEKAKFSVRLDPCEAGAHGSDEAVFLFSANSAPQTELSRCASGGELSRIMLSIKQLLCEFTNMPTMVFDEIDTGVSGSAADRMGSVICSMGERMQVFAITHLPQVAAKGKAHFLVQKSLSDDGNVRSGIERLDDDGRIREIARMLSGERVTDTALANARSLLGKN